MIQPSEWKQVGQLPVASAYGVTISTEKGLICVGGTTAARSLSDVFLLSLQEDILVTDTLPSLPVTIDNMAGALIGDLLYIVGGNVNGVPSADMYSLDLSNMDKGWQKEPGVPGEPRVQPVCAAQGGKLYVWGGFAPAADGREATLSVDGYVFSGDESVDFGSDSGRIKKEKAFHWEVEQPFLWGEEAILCIGGVNKDIFLKALQGIYSGKEYLSHPAEWYQFNKNLLLYYPAKDEWSSLGEYEQGARAGAVMVADGVYAYIINGELKPGIRTNEINRIKENRK